VCVRQPTVIIYSQSHWYSNRTITNLGNHSRHL